MSLRIMLNVIRLSKPLDSKYNKEWYLICFEEEEAEVGEDDPQLLPAIAVLELPQEVPTQLVLKGQGHSSAQGHNVICKLFKYFCTAQ